MHVCSDVAALVKQGTPVIVVHGGSAETNVISEQLGHPPRFVTNTQGFTSRYTDRQTLEIFAMVTNGKINTLLVETLQKAGVNAFGLSGLDGRLMVAKRKDAIRIVENGRQRILRDDYTGKIETVNGGLLNALVGMGFTPVVSPLAISPEGDGAERGCRPGRGHVAGAVQAEQLIILTNVPGPAAPFPRRKLADRAPAQGRAGTGALVRRRPHEEKGAGRHRGARPGCGQGGLCRRPHRAPALSARWQARAP